MLWLGHEAAPAKHLRHGVKVLLKFKLLEWQQVGADALLQWAQATPYLVRLHRRHAPGQGFPQWLDELLDDLVRAGAAARNGAVVHNVG